MTSYTVYHGSRKEKKFSGAASSGLGEWFGTDNREYAGEHGIVRRYRIELENPYPMELREFREYDRGIEASFKKSKEYRDELEKMGHDSITVKHHDGVNEYILFDKRKARRIGLF